VPGLVFNLVGIWLLDRAENWRSVFWAMGDEGGVVEPWPKDSRFYGGTTLRWIILPILSGFELKFYGRSKPVIHCFSQLLPRQRRQSCLLVFLMLQ
jgi:hypothetical protein